MSSSSTTCAGKDFSTWSRPNRRFVSAGVYMPSGISQQVKELVIALDTSGSIGQRELTAFLSEVKAVCDMVHPERIRLLYWDTEICGDESYRYYRIVYPSAKHQASRWWWYRRAVCAHYMTEHKIDPQAVIVFTDGYVYDWGTWSCPVLWAVYDNKQAKPDCGKVLHIGTNKL